MTNSRYRNLKKKVFYWLQITAYMYSKTGKYSGKASDN